MGCYATAIALNNVVQIITNLLAMAGAFLVGGQLMKVFIQFMSSMFFMRKQLPKPAMRVMQYCGGILAAVLIGFLLFGTGAGFGFGSGAGTGGSGDGTDTELKGESKSSELFKDVKIQPKDQKESKDEKEEQLPPGEQRVKVTILGGYDAQDRYYRVPKLKDKIGFEELVHQLRQRQSDGVHPLKGVTILVYKNSPAMDHRIVKRLHNWAKENGLSVDYPPVQDQNIP